MDGMMDRLKESVHKFTALFPVVKYVWIHLHSHPKTQNQKLLSDMRSLFFILIAQINFSITTNLKELKNKIIDHGNQFFTQIP